MHNKKLFATVLGFFLLAGFMPLQAQLAKQGLQQIPRALGKNVIEESATAAAWKNFGGVLPSASAAAAAAKVEVAPASIKSQDAKQYPGAVAAY